MLKRLWGICLLAIAAPLLGQQRDSTNDSVAPVAVRPAGWVQDHDFPSAARASGKHGAVRFVLAIDAAGAVYRCDVVRTSGVPLLDKQTCDLMLSRAKFVAAKDQSGAAVASEWSRRVAWGQGGQDDPASNYDAILRVATLPSGKKFADVVIKEVIGADGARDGCSVEVKSGDAGLDDQACAIVAQAMTIQALKNADGAPVRGLRVQRIGFLAAGS